MTEAYTVDAALNWKTNVPEVLRQLTRGFEEVDRLISSTQSNLGRLATDLKELTSSNRGIGALARALDKVKIPEGTLSGLREMTSITRDLADQQSLVARDAMASAKAFREMAQASRQMALGGGGGGRHGGGSHSSMLDAAMGAQMIGNAGTGYFEQSISAAAHVNHTLAVITADQRVTATQQAAVQALAQQTVRSVPGSTVGGNLEIFNDLKNTFGDINEAMEHLGTFSKLVTSLQIMDMSHGGEGNLRQALNTAKFIEDQGGAIDPNNPTRYDGKRFEEIAAKIIAVDVATGGRVDPAAMLAFQKQARTGGMMMSDHALYGETPYFANAFGASKLGTALFSDVQVMLGGRLMKEHEQELEYYGVIPKGSGHYVKGKGPNGRPKYEWTYDPRSMGQAGLLASDPYAWIHDFLAPKVIAKEHLDVTKKPDLDRLLLILTQLAQRGTQAGLWADAYRGYGPAQKEAANIAAQNPDMLKHFMATDPTAQIMQFRSAENELMVTVGQAVMGPAIESLKALTGVLRDMSDWAKNNPDAAKSILVVSGGLAVLSKIAGDAAMAIFVGAPLVKGLGSLARAALPFSAGGSGEAALATLSGATGLGEIALLLGGLALAVTGLPPLLKAVTDLLPSGVPGANTRHPTHAGGASGQGTSWSQYMGGGSGQPQAGQSWSDYFWGSSSPHPGANQRSGVHKEFYSSQTAPVHVFPIALQLEGKTVARVVAKHIANSWRVDTGPTWGDMRAMPVPDGATTGA